MLKTKAYLTNDDIEAMLQNEPSLRNRAILRLLWRGGMRVSELVSIDVEDIDFRGQVLTIRRLKESIKLACPHCGSMLAKVHTFCPGCGSKVGEATREKLHKERRRRIRIDTSTLELIREYLQKERLQSASDNRLFPLTRQRVYYIVREAAERVGLEGRILTPEELTEKHFVSPHRFRDAFATTWAKADGGLESQRDLQAHLGHASFLTTSRYFKRTREEIGETYDKVWKEK